MFTRNKDEEDLVIPQLNKKKKKEDEESIWDRRKIFAAVLVLLILFFTGFYVRGMFSPSTDVKGSFTYQPKEKDITDTISKEVPTNLQTNLDNIKNSVENLDVSDVASSSPQVQKVLNDIKALKDYPTNQAKQACLNVCAKL